MARCPTCGKVWTCGNPDEWLSRMYPEDEEDEADPYCTKCKCPNCRKPNDRMTIDEEYYGKRA